MLERPRNSRIDRKRNNSSDSLYDEQKAGFLLGMGRWKFRTVHGVMRCPSWNMRAVVRVRLYKGNAFH